MRRFAWNALLVIASFVLVFGLVAFCLSVSASDASIGVRILGAVPGMLCVGVFVWVLSARTRWLRGVAIYTSFQGLRDAVAAGFRAEAPSDEDLALLDPLRREGEPDLARIYERALERRANSAEDEALFRKVAEAIFRVLSQQEHTRWRT